MRDGRFQTVFVCCVGGCGHGTNKVSIRRNTFWFRILAFVSFLFAIGNGVNKSTATVVNTRPEAEYLYAGIRNYTTQVHLEMFTCSAH